MKFAAVGINYKTAPLNFREELFIPVSRQKEFLRLLISRPGINAAVLLQTCNRMEIYFQCNIENAGEYIISRINNVLGPQQKTVSRNRFYFLEDYDAMEHLVKVACGLDSMIIGENQIYSQVKSAFNDAIKNGYSSPEIERIFSAAFRLTKQIRSSSRIYNGKVSFGSIVKDLIVTKYGSVERQNILLIGLGKINRLILKYVSEAGAGKIFITNRSFEKAKALAGEFNAQAVKFDMYKDYISEADVIISASSAPHWIIKKTHFVGLAIRNNILVFDLAVPRDVEPDIGNLAGIELVTLEDIGNISSANNLLKENEAFIAEEQIKKEVKEIWKRSSRSVPEPALSL